MDCSDNSKNSTTKSMYTYNLLVGVTGKKQVQHTKLFYMSYIHLNSLVALNSFLDYVLSICSYVYNISNCDNPSDLWQDIERFIVNGYYSCSTVFLFTYWKYLYVHRRKEPVCSNCC